MAYFHYNTRYTHQTWHYKTIADDWMNGQKQLDFLLL